MTSIASKSNGWRLIGPDEFIEATFDRRGEGEHICVSKMFTGSDGKAGFHNVGIDHESFKIWAGQPEHRKQPWYVSVATTNGKLNKSGKGLARGRKYLVAVHAFVADDVGTKAKPSPVDPSYKLESSQGNFQHGYLFRRPVTDMQRFEAFVEWCADQGYTDAGATGAYRIVRLPGSCNTKPGRDEWIARCEVPDDGMPDWKLEELAEAFGLDEGTWQRYMANIGTTTGKKEKSGGAAAALGQVTDPLLTWLADNDHVVSDQGGNFVDVVCPWHANHTTGANTAGYSPLGRGDSEHNQERRAFHCMHEHCKGHKFDDFLKWVVDHGGPEVSRVGALELAQGRYVYVKLGQRVVDMQQREKGGGVWNWPWADWAKAERQYVQIPGRERTVLLTTAFLDSRDTRKAATTRFSPTTEDGLLEICGQTVVNTYMAPRHPETPSGDIPLEFVEHVTYLMPSPVERELFLDWFACGVQRPWQRRYAIVMHTESYGTGRGWLVDLCRCLWPGMVESVTVPQLLGKGNGGDKTYNNWEVGKLLLTIDEAKEEETNDYFKAYESLKQRIDPRGPTPLRANAKYGALTDEEAWHSILVCSNHDDALVIPDGDRRIAVFKNPTETREREYYTRLYACLDPGSAAAFAARVWWWLKRRDIAAFSPHHPPVTESKLAMIEHHRLPSDAILRHLRENAPSDLITRTRLERAVRGAGVAVGLRDKVDGTGSAHLARAIWRSLKSLRPDDPKNGCRVRVDSEQHEVRAIRNRAQWVERDRSGDRAAFADELAKVARTADGTAVAHGARGY
jgi:hypothetical protein